MRKYTIEHVVYKFEELSEEAQEKALEMYRHKHQESLYEDSAWSTQNDDCWQMALEEYGLCYGGYDKTYFDTYRGGSGFGGLDIDDYAKLADKLGLDRRTKAWQLIANKDIQFNLMVGGDCDSIRDVDFEEYGITWDEFDELPDKTINELEKACEHIKSFVQDLEAELLKGARQNEEYTFSDESLKEMFEANEYEFYEDGRLA